jgi:hypothetical protein
LLREAFEALLLRTSSPPPRETPSRDLLQALGVYAVANQVVATPELVAQALPGIERVMIVESSEVAETWTKNANEAAADLANIDNLRRRLE